MQPAFFLAGNRVRNGVAWRGQRRRIQILAIDALHNSDFRLPVLMKTRLKMLVFQDGGRYEETKSRRPVLVFWLLKENVRSDRERKHALHFLHFQRMKSFVEFGKTVWRESRGKTISV